MIDYPLSIPSRSAYRELGIEPHATFDEIRDARARVISRIESTLQGLRDGIGAIEQHVPGLAEARAGQRQGDSGDRSEGRGQERSRRELRALERQATKTDPRYLGLREQVDVLEERLRQINALPILDPKERRSYDREHPPLGLLRIDPCIPDPYRDRGTLLAFLRQEVTRFLEERGEEVFHPTDLTRRDFSGDFDYTPLLDEAADSGSTGGRDD